MSSAPSPGPVLTSSGSGSHGERECAVPASRVAPSLFRGWLTDLCSHFHHEGEETEARSCGPSDSVEG